MSTLILDSLKALYNDKPDVLQLLPQLDLSSLEEEFYAHLYSKIDKDTFERIDKLLRSSECAEYNSAVAYATYALIDSLDGITKLIDLEKKEMN